ncbi:hypothetical protein HCN44_002105 [Aphidius gifuensis]|uniref:NADH dehydrogenase [ubiquinone] 1 alpha subcomplex subunit 5 n=1 Tax=Aphidius gifuensis TaxID=684658 RepID=A0A834Y2F1_APHGI|nr:hypothetical protein HCN44_002105 [Aphidius gifuensis]
MASAAKHSTLLTGLAVSKLPRRTLGNLYAKILRSLEKCPAESAYRKNVESIVKERAAIVKSTEDVAKIENKIGCGQVEELILQAENELLLTRRMINWKPWEATIQPPKHQWVWPPHK